MPFTDGDRLQELDRKIPEAERKLKETGDALIQSRLESDRENARIEAGRKALQEKRAKMRFPDLKTAEAAAKALDNEIAARRKALADAKKAVEDCGLEINRLKGMIEQANETLKEEEPKDPVVIFEEPEQESEIPKRDS